MNKDISVRDVMRQNVAFVDGRIDVMEAMRVMKRVGATSLIVEKRNEDDEYGMVLFSDIAKDGVTARIFPQNGPMSTTRSLTTGRLPIAEITGTRPSCATSYMRVLQARTAAPSMRIPQEPQIIIRQLLR